MCSELTLSAERRAEELLLFGPRVGRKHGKTQSARWRCAGWRRLSSHLDQMQQFLARAELAEADLLEILVVHQPQRIQVDLGGLELAAVAEQVVRLHEARQAPPDAAVAW